MNKLLGLFLALAILVSPLSGIAATPEGENEEGRELEGDTRLSCEALLCLSSGTRPGECGPSLSRYFGISKKKWSDTLNARRDFLNQCPASSEPGMPSLVESILNGAGRCNAALLNRLLARRVTVIECDDTAYWLTEEERCYEKVITIIDDRLPSYCRNYMGHDYTWKVGAVYSGDTMNGGRWIDE